MNDELLMGRKFHPWEGGEGKATTQYTVSLIEQAKKALKENAYADAKKLLEQALGNTEKAKALRELGALTPSNSRFYKLISYGEAHIYDKVKMDYFAVSYPDLLIFNEDFTKKNRAHCCFLMDLGNLGLGNNKKAEAYLRETLQLDPHHLMAQLYLRGIAG